MNQVLVVLLLIFGYQGHVKATQIGTQFRPTESGYVANVTFEYKMQNCFNDLHIGIKTNLPFTATEYLYKGKSYSPTDIGLTSFSNLKRIYVETLKADLIDSGQKAGEVTMSNVINQSGAGCYGQSYSAKKSISTFDGKAASQRLGDFTLANVRITGSTMDINIESLINKKEKDAETAIKAEQMATIGTAISTPLNGVEAEGPLAPQTSTTTPVGQQSPNLKPEATSSLQADPPVDLQEYQKQVQQNIELTNKNSKEIGEKAGQAAGHLGSAASGMWDSGAGIGVGFMYQEQDSTFIIQAIMADWKNSWSGNNPPSDFWAGSLIYIGVDIMGTEPTTGVELSPGYDKFTRAIMGFDFINNSWGQDQLRLVFGPTLNFVDTFGPNGVAIDELELEFGFDVGLALAGNGVLGALTYNLQSEVIGFHLVFHK